MELSNFFAAFSFVAVFIYVHIGFYTLRQNKTSILNRVFFLLCLSYAIWSFAYSFAYLAESEEVLSFWNKVSAFGWCTFSAFSLYLVLLITENKITRSKPFIALLFLPAAVFLFMALFLFGPDIETPAAVSKFFYIGDFLYDFSYAGLSIILLLQWGLHSESLRVKKQSAILVICSTVPFCLNLLTQTLLPIFGYNKVPLMGQLYSLIMILGAYFVINKYKMLRFPKNIILDEVEKKIIELVILLDDSGQFLQVSQHILKLLGFEESDLVGKNITSLFDKPDHFRFTPAMLMQENEYDDIQIFRKNGEKLPVQIMCVPIIDEILQEYLGSLLIVRDISKEYELRAINAELHERTIRDSLTNLYNHQHSLEILHKEISKQKESSETQGLAIMMLDIDHFKKINDTFGHLFGDYVIQTISEIMRRNVGENGYVGRFGGEEFIIILPKAEIETAAEIGEKIREEIRLCRFKEPVHVTISIGLAQLEEENPLQLLKKADDLLYKAKQNGRNRMELSPATSSL